MNLGHDFLSGRTQLEWQLRQYSDEQLAEVSEHLKQEWAEKKKKKEFLLCRNCSYIITSMDLKIEINGRNLHTFKNPAGVVYTIGCFSKAAGCFNFGDFTEEYTWFPGFAWCYANCFNCFTHLGWFYQSGQKSFYGLIIDNLKPGVSGIHSNN
jgi:hypothetical protein